MTDTIINFLFVLFYGCVFMVIALLLTAVVKMLPKSIRDRIENYHNE